MPQRGAAESSKIHGAFIGNNYLRLIIASGIENQRSEIKERHCRYCCVNSLAGIGLENK